MLSCYEIHTIPRKWIQLKVKKRNSIKLNKKTIKVMRCQEAAMEEELKTHGLIVKFKQVVSTQVPVGST